MPRHNAPHSKRPYYPFQRFGPVEPRPYPFGPLLEALRTTHGAFAKRHGVSGRDVKVMVEQGLTEYQADKYAIRAGLHPGDVWPDLWWAA